MVKETVQSLKAENDKLKEKVDAVFGELKQLKECLKQQHPGSHDASNGDAASATKPLDFLSKQYDDLVKFRKQAEEYLPWRNLWLSYRFLLIILLRRTLQAIEHISYSISSPHRLNTLATYPEPNTVARLRPFIGAYKVLSRVIPRCSSYLAPLVAVTAGRSSQESINWTDDLRAAFRSAQNALSLHSPSHYPDPRTSYGL